jgi:cadmium resistance protein CadD (predicted permease)
MVDDVNLLAAAGLGVTVFVSTNVDDIFVLVACFADSRLHAQHVILGQYLGIAILVGISLVGAWVSLLVAPAYVGLLGTLPILIGFKKLFELRGSAEATDDTGRRSARSATGALMSVTAITVANGSDNIAIYAPLFSVSRAVDMMVIITVFAMMTTLWIIAARWLVNHPALGAPIRRYGHRGLPFVLIALGLLILYEAGWLAVSGAV